MKILRNDETDFGSENCTSAVLSRDGSSESWTYTSNVENHSSKIQNFSFSIQNSSFIINYKYSPFGKITRTTGDIASRFVFRFSSEYSDTETGLVYYNYRYYSPELGRWLSRDPIGESSGVNFYEFIFNDSINLVDLLGLEAVIIETIKTQNCEGTRISYIGDPYYKKTTTTSYTNWIQMLKISKSFVVPIADLPVKFDISMTLEGRFKIVKEKVELCQKGYRTTVIYCCINGQWVIQYEHLEVERCRVVKPEQIISKKLETRMSIKVTAVTSDLSGTVEVGPPIPLVDFQY